MGILENKGVIIVFIVIAILTFFLFRGAKDLGDERADYITNKSSNEAKVYEDMANHQLDKIKANEKKMEEIME